MNNIKPKPSPLQAPLTLILSALYFCLFLFALLALDSRCSLLCIINDRFSDTPSVLTIGEHIMNACAVASPLLLGTAFLIICFSKTVYSHIGSRLLLAAAFVAIAGITIFSCLNVYRIIEIFSYLSNNTAYIGDSLKSYYTTMLIHLICYHVLIIFYAGSISGFALQIKQNNLNNRHRSNALLFGLSNALLAIWHTIFLLFPIQLIDNYFNKTNVGITNYYLEQVLTIVCYTVAAALGLTLYLKTRNSSTNKGESI